MSVQWVLLPVFVLVGVTFALLLGTGARRSAAANRETTIRDSALDQFGLPMLFYVLIAIALPIRHADLIIVMLSWVFVVCRLVHAGQSHDHGPARGRDDLRGKGRGLSQSGACDKGERQA